MGVRILRVLARMSLEDVSRFVSRNPWDHSINDYLFHVDTIQAIGAWVMIDLNVFEWKE